jgi:hypothetical protein
MQREQTLMAFTVEQPEIAAASVAASPSDP